jgi:kumamolisin
LTYEEVTSVYGASPDDVAQVIEFATQHGLEVTEQSKNKRDAAARRTLTLRGPAESYRQAFAVAVGKYERKSGLPGAPYVGREGWVYVPAALKGVIEGVFGLDNRPIGVRRTPIQFLSTAGRPTPPQVAKLYNFPAVATNGQCIALLEFGGGFHQADIDTYFQSIGVATPNIKVVGVGQTNNPGVPGQEKSDCEVTLDIDIAGSVAPGATLVLYFAPLTEKGWIDVLTECVHDTTYNPSVISISWGAGELQRCDSLAWTKSGMDAMKALFAFAALKHKTVLAATGDDGSDCRVLDRRAHVTYPASDPCVIGCGGTSIANFAAAPSVETPWSRGGGGISRVHSTPDYQQNNVTLPCSVNTGEVKRGVPDVSGYAAPGYTFIYKLAPFEPSGTSLTAPLYAALVARLNAKFGHSLGFMHPDLYALVGSSVYRDMTGGSSNSYMYAPGYHSGPGWDACTGLGVIDGNALLAAL